MSVSWMLFIGKVADGVSFRYNGVYVQALQYGPLEHYLFYRKKQLVEGRGSMTTRLNDCVLRVVRF